MSCADCNPGANVALSGGDNVTVTGVGTANDPYTISVDSVPDGDYAKVSLYTSDGDIDLTDRVLPETVLVDRGAFGGDVLLPVWPDNRSGSLTIFINSSGVGTLTFPNVLVEGGDGSGYSMNVTSGYKYLFRVLWTGNEWVLTDELIAVA